MGVDLFTLQLAKKYAEKLVEGAGAIAGKSAYEIAKKNGYSGSEKEWLQSLKGEPGVSPTIEITEDKEGNHTVIIKDEDGSHSFVVKDGKGGGNGEVISFNGRKGIITPQIGDYNIEMITVLDDNGEPIKNDDGSFMNIIDYIANTIKEHKSDDNSNNDEVPIPYIVDSLDSDENDKALSARQGKILDGKITELQNRQPLNGIDGKDGVNGKDGISPTITFEEKNNGVVLHIIDINGEHSTLIKNGINAAEPTIQKEQIKKNLITTQGDIEISLQPNEFYYFVDEAPISLSLTLNDIINDSIVNEYHFMFKTGETAPLFTLPNSILFPKDFKIEANKIYEISILENCLSYQCWEK